METARCGQHPGSLVVSVGTRQRSDGLSRRYRCTPAAGKPHTFTVRITEDKRPAAWSPPPPCPEHPGSKVVRNGTYGVTTEKKRQRYRCAPPDGSKPHAFTPPLPRDHVHEGNESCEHCEELRGVHHGETAAARRHSWSTRVVARGLQRLAEGASYAEVGRWARRVTGSERRRGVSDQVEGEEEVTTASTKRRVSPASRAARNAWHIAADWTEVFGPVVWNEVDGDLRKAAYSERERLDDLMEANQPIDYPQVLLLDDQPVYGRDLDDRRRRRDAGYYVLVAGEVSWDNNEPVTRLRLARALAKSTTAAWFLILDEIGYEPDFIVADNGTGLVAAVNRYCGSRTVFVPSVWHLINRIEGALYKVPNAFSYGPAGRELVSELAAHLRRLHRGSRVLSSVKEWEQWWDDLEALMRARKLPVDAVRAQRKYEFDAVAAAIPHLVAHPEVPISTGGLETLLTRHIKPLLSMRRTGFANLERTNRLMDLAVANHHNAFDDLADVVKLLRDDANAWGGWTAPLRAIADPRPPGDTNSSLRDQTLLNDLAAQRGFR